MSGDLEVRPPVAVLQGPGEQGALHAADDGGRPKVVQRRGAVQHEVPAAKFWRSLKDALPLE